KACNRFAKNSIGRTLDRLGYQLSRKVPDGAENGGLTAYEVGLFTLVAALGEVRIVQVGANDGAINDPIYGFVRKFADRTNILLVEPQEYLLPYLEENYRFHRQKTIFNGAVGPSGVLKLYV